MTEAMGSLGKNNPCIVCCGKNKKLKIFHRHLSTAHYNKEMRKLGESDVMCYFCDTHHPINHMSRPKIILTTSTLNGVQFIEGWDWGNHQPTHVDIESIPGARIATLKKAWERAYCTNPFPIDTLLVAGLNDINYFARLHTSQGVHHTDLAVLVSEDIISQIKSIQNLIKNHSKAFLVDDTLAVATILHTPSMYWHEADGEVPTSTYVNLKHVVDRTNLKIQDFNLHHGVPYAPKFQGSGERKKGMHRGYQFSHWREENREDMLHLKDKYRIKMMKAYIKYFEKATPPAQQIIG